MRKNGPGGARSVSGKPFAPSANNRRKAVALRAARVVSASVALTLRREILTAWPDSKCGWSLIFWSVNKAIPSAHRQNFRMPTWLAGSINVNSRAFRRCAWAMPSSSRSPATKASPPSPGPKVLRRSPRFSKAGRGSQHAPRARSSQMSFRILVIWRPWPKDTPSFSSVGRWGSRAGQW